MQIALKDGGSDQILCGEVGGSLYRELLSKCKKYQTGILIAGVCSPVVAEGIHFGLQTTSEDSEFVLKFSDSSIPSLTVRASFTGESEV